MTTKTPARNRRANGSFYLQSETPIELEQLRDSCPSVFQVTPSPSVSKRYEFISTVDILNRLADDGFQIFEARCAGVRDPVERGFGLHMVRLRKLGEAIVPGEIYPEAVLTNAHNRDCALSLDLGLYRGVCANGLVTATSAGTSFRLTHQGDRSKDVVKAANELITYGPRLAEVIARWGQRRLHPSEIGKFIDQAAALRYGDETPKDVDWGRVRRDEDAGDDLWRVFNRVQENLMDGGLPYRSKNGRRATTRSVGAVSRVLAINKGLWSLAEEFSPN